jgi:hypothetical protein
MSAAGVIVEVLVGVGEWLLNRARKPSPTEQAKHEQARKQQAEWAARVAARKG